MYKISHVCMYICCESEKLNKKKKERKKLLRVYNVEIMVYRFKIFYILYKYNTFLIILHQTDHVDCF